MDSDETELESLLVRAGKLAATHQGHSSSRTKADGSPVTDTDELVEKVIAEGLRKVFPGDGIRGEEGAFAEGENVWVIDPIDGTSAFLEGLAYWGPSVARITPGGQVDLGGLFLPRIGDYFSVCRGSATLNGKPLPRRDSLPVLYIPSKLHTHFTLDWPGKARCLGSTAAHLALIAAGSAQGVLVGPGWGLWDVACGIGMLRATGCVARVVGEDVDLDLRRHRGEPFIAGLPAVVEMLLEPGRITARSRDELA